MCHRDGQDQTKTGPLWEHPKDQLSQSMFYSWLCLKHGTQYGGNRLKPAQPKRFQFEPQPVGTIPPSGFVIP